MDVFDLVATIRLNMSEYEQGLNQAKKKTESFAKSLSGFSSNAEKVLKPAVEGFKAVENVGKQTANVIKTGLKGFAAAATAVGGFGTAAVKSGMAFDATMSEVSAISGAVGQDFDDLRNKALEMGAKTKFSASEAASAMTYMGMAGWKASDMIGGIEGIMNLAAASGEDLATTSDIVTDALTAFGLQASDSGHFANVMAVAASNANTNVGMMGETFKYVAPVAGALGYSVDDTAMAIGLMANSGIKASQAGTSLRSIMTRLSTDAGASSKKLGALGVLTENLGVSFYDTEGNARDLNSVLAEAREAWKGLSDEQAISYAKTIAGQEAMSGWLALMNAAPGDIDKLTESLKKADEGIGAAGEMAATMIDNLQGDLTLLGSAFESLQIAISDSLTPTLREFAQFGQKAMQNLLEGFQDDGVSGFMSALTGIVTDGAKMLAEKAPDFVSVGLRLVESVAIGIMNAREEISIAANEIVFRLVDSLGYMLENYWPEMVSIGNDIVTFIFKGFLDAGDLISGYIGDFVPLIVNAFTAYYDALFTVGMEILGSIGKGFVDNKEEIQQWISVTIEDMVVALRENAPDIIDGALALLEALVGAISENATLVGESAGDIVTHLLESLSEAADDLIPAAYDMVLKLAEGLTEPGSMEGMIDAALDLISSLIQGLLDGLEMMNERGPEIVGRIAEAIIANLPKILEVGVQLLAGLVQGMINGLVMVPKVIAEVVAGIVRGFCDLFGIHSPSTVFAEMGENLIAGLLEGIAQTWESIVEFFSGAAEALIEFLGNAWDTIKEAATTAWEAIKGVFVAAWDAIVGVWDGALGFFSGIWDGIKTAASAVGEAVGGAFKSAWDAITSVWDGALDFFGGIWDSITNVFSDAWSIFSDIGGNIVKGIWDGITSLGSWLWNNVTGFFGGIVDGVKGMLGIHSPSTVFAGIGGNMARGVGVGWDNEYNGIKREIESGLNFGTAYIGVTANTSYNATRNDRNGTNPGLGGFGNTYVTINSPVAVDAVQAAREWKKTTQRMAMGYV